MSQKSKSKKRGITKSWVKRKEARTHHVAVRRAKKKNGATAEGLSSAERRALLHMLPGFAGPMMDSVMKGDRFVQIAGVHGTLFALDATGQVWQFDRTSLLHEKWIALSRDRAPHRAVAGFGLTPRGGGL